MLLSQTADVWSGLSQIAETEFQTNVEFAINTLVSNSTTFRVILHSGHCVPDATLSNETESIITASYD